MIVFHALWRLLFMQMTIQRQTAVADRFNFCNLVTMTQQQRPHKRSSSTVWNLADRFAGLFSHLHIERMRNGHCCSIDIFDDGTATTNISRNLSLVFGFLSCIYRWIKIRDGKWRKDHTTTTLKRSLLMTFNDPLSDTSRTVSDSQSLSN